MAMRAFSAAVRKGTRFAFWNTKPKWPRLNARRSFSLAAGCEMILPSNRTSPLVGGYINPPILSSVGYDVETCGSGAEALRRLIVGLYDVVVLDLVMPEVSAPTNLRQASSGSASMNP